MEDVLISLGLIVQKEELNALFDGKTEIDFQKYLIMLKESTVRNTRGIKGNFLKDRTLHFEPVLQSKNKQLIPNRKKAPSRENAGSALPSLVDDHSG